MLSKIKQILINQSINNPIKTLFVSLGLTLFVFLGIQYFYLEDDLIAIYDTILDEYTTLTNSMKERINKVAKIKIRFIGGG